MEHEISQVCKIHYVERLSATDVERILLLECFMREQANGVC